MRTKLTIVPRLILYPLIMAGLLVGCSNEVDEPGGKGGTGGAGATGGSGGSGATGGTGATGGSGGSGGTGAAGGSGGSGGSIIGCEEDCSAIDTAECQLSVCDETIGECVLVEAADDTSCDDGLFCTTGDTCLAGACVGPTAKDCGDTGSECSIFTCDEASDSCLPVAANEGGSCAPEDLCQVDGVCAEGSCEGVAKDCSAADDACAIGVCDPTDGSCVGELVPEGTECGGDTCSPAFCTATGACEVEEAPEGTSCEASASCTDNICAAGGCYPSASCIVRFADDFDGCEMSAWTLGGDWACGVPEAVGPTSAPSGTQLLATNPAGTYAHSQSFDTAFAQLPTVDLAGLTNPVLSFWGWVRSEGVDGFNIKISTDGGLTYSIVNSVSPAYPGTGNSQPIWSGDYQSWRQFSVDLTDYVGQQVDIRFSFRSDSSVTYPGIYVDDVRVQERNAVPVSVTTASVGPAYVGNPFRAALEGVAGNAVWSIAGGTNHGWLSIDPATGVLSGTPTTIGLVTVTVRISEASLPWNRADKTYRFAVEPPSTLEENFEACAGWTFSGSWACGTPTVVGPASAFSGQNLIATDLSQNYPHNVAWASATASSPAIDLTGLTSPSITFWTWFQTEGNTYDGWNVKISTDGGSTYTVLNSVMPAYDLTVSTQPAWGGQGTSWRKHSIDLSTFVGQTIHLRFDMRSDGSTAGAGVYIDEIRLGEAHNALLALSGKFRDAYRTEAYVAKPARSGGSAGAVWSIVGSHPWLSIDRNTGELSGTPTTAGPTTVTVRVEESVVAWNYDERTYEFNVNPAVFFDSFENCANWTMTGEWACGVPTSGPNGTIHGKNVLATNLSGNYSSNIAWGTATATSSTINLAGTQAPMLAFSAWYRTEGNTYDGWNIKVSNDGGTTFTEVTGVTPVYPLTISTQPAWGGQVESWKTHTLDLSPWIGQSIQVRFDFRSDGSSTYSGAYIDRIIVTD